MATQPLDRRSVSDQLFEELARAVLAGHYAPGEKLPTQRRLAEQYGVNMATVRQAVKQLEQLRLIEVRHGDAMRVRDWRRHGSLDLVAQMLFSAGTLDAALLANVLEARRLLLTECARLAAGRRSEAQAARIAELAERITTEHDTAAAQAIDFEFYEELAEASGNLVFTMILNTTRDLYLQNAALFAAIVGNRERLLPLYTTAAGAIAGGDADAAAGAVAELAELQERQMLELAAPLAGGGAA
jgi:DNA-binding FadR family transcriptional regulator